MYLTSFQRFLAPFALPQVSSPDEQLQRLLVGGVSGVISRTLIAPLERLRTLMMLSREPAGLAKSCARMWADGGLAGGC